MMMARRGSVPSRSWRGGPRLAAALWFALASVGALFCISTPARASGVPPAYAALVVQPDGLPDRAEFDLTPALARARREGRRLYVYLGANDCPFCRRYEAFLDKNAAALIPEFKPYLIVDLRSSLSLTSKQIWFKVGDRSLPYTEFLQSFNDERARRLVYPSVWLFDTDLKPLMQMPGGTGTFETVPEQLEILQLVQ